MATFSINISPYAKKDGTRNVRVLVFHNDEKKYIPKNKQKGNRAALSE